MNTIFVLILFAHVEFGRNSNALTVAEFTSAERCAAAGAAAERLSAGSTKSIKWVCMPK